MDVKDFVSALGAEFFCGVPDSQLKALCDRLIKNYGTDPLKHVIAANEGNCVALAAGYHLATGKVPVVYMQNSGEGNIVNPLASLLNDKVYAIPCIFVIGWRGEPGVHDEPQHIYQGEVTLKLLTDMDVEHFVVDKTTTKEEILAVVEGWKECLSRGKQVAFVIKKGALSSEEKVSYEGIGSLLREDAVRMIARHAGKDPIVSTTGKASRELFEMRTALGEGHERDFLTVGSMGHASSIALGIALNKPQSRVWCIDGDGAALMHMGAMAVIGEYAPKNLVHIVINNGAHETVGGMPTAARSADLVGVAKACGYKYAERAKNGDELEKILTAVRSREGLTFIETECKVGSRADLGRPTTTAIENKNNFMNYLKTLK